MAFALPTPLLMTVANAPSESAPSLLVSILLGLLQGLTEFLPISSSGHLVLAQSLLGAPRQGIVMEVVLHAGTLLAVLVSFRRDLAKIARDSWGGIGRGEIAPSRWSGGMRDLVLVVLATLPVVVVGLLWKEPIEQLFESPRLATVALVATGLILLSTRWVKQAALPVRWNSALVMGLLQVLSLVPGISRSGATISGGLFARTDPRQAARFSFLMSIPAILGSLILQFPALDELFRSGEWAPYLAGLVAAFLSGLAAIEILMRIVARGRFFVFGLYCLVVGVVGFLLM